MIASGMLVSDSAFARNRFGKVPLMVRKGASTPLYSRSRYRYRRVRTPKKWWLGIEMGTLGQANNTNSDLLGLNLAFGGRLLPPGV